MSVSMKYENCKFLLIFLSSFALTLTFVISIATGWVNVNYFTKDRFVPKESAITGKSERKENGKETIPSLSDHNVTVTSIPVQGKATIDQQIATAEKSVNHRNNRKTRQNRQQKKKTKPSVPSGIQKVTFSAGLWYFSVCVVKHGGKNKCDITSYRQANRKSYSLPDELQGAGLETIYTNIGEIAIYGMVEFQIEVVVSIICLLTGILTTRMFFDTNDGRKLLFGIMTLITHITAGFLLVAIAVRFVIMRAQVGVILAEYRFVTLSPLTFEHSACPIIACVSGIIALCCSIALLVVLSNVIRVKSNAISCSRSIPGPPFGMVSTTGRHTFHDLMMSLPYTKDYQ